MPLEESREKQRPFLSRAILGLLSLEPVLQLLISAQSPWESELVEARKQGKKAYLSWWLLVGQGPPPPDQLGAHNCSQWAVGVCNKCENKYLDSLSLISFFSSFLKYMIHEINLLLQGRWFYQLKHISFLFALVLSDLSRRITFQCDIHGLMLDKGKVFEHS